MSTEVFATSAGAGVWNPVKAPDNISDGDAGSNSLSTGVIALAPDGSYDELRTVADAAPGLGVLAVGARSPGASDTISKWAVSATNTATRATVATPTSGKKIRLTALTIASGYGTLHRVAVYFGTGTDISTAPSKAVTRVYMVANTGHFDIAWPDGAGPVGAVNDVLSWRTNDGIDAGANNEIAVHYREE